MFLLSTPDAKEHWMRRSHARLDQRITVEIESAADYRWRRFDNQRHFSPTGDFTLGSKKVRKCLARS